MLYEQKIKVLTTCLMLNVSCVSEPVNFGFNYRELKEKVVTVELINYDRTDPRIVKGARIFCHSIF